MSDQIHSTSRPLIQQLINKAADATDDQLLRALLIIQAGDAGKYVWGDQPKPKSEARSKNSNGENMDTVLARYVGPFRAAMEIHNKEFKGSSSLGDLFKELDKRSMSPFKSFGLQKSVPLLARHLARNYRRLEPPCSASKATPETMVWTKEAWRIHTSA